MAEQLFEYGTQTPIRTFNLRQLQTLDQLQDAINYLETVFRPYALAHREEATRTANKILKIIMKIQKKRNSYLIEPLIRRFQMDFDGLSPEETVDITEIIRKELEFHWASRFPQRDELLGIVGDRVARLIQDRRQSGAAEEPASKRPRDNPPDPPSSSSGSGMKGGAYSMRKIRGKDLYKVTNTETGEVKSSGSTKKDAKAQLRLLRSLEKKGGSLKADQLQQVLENTYKETDDAPTGYTLDKDLSDDRVKVYKDMNSDQVIVAHRGSKGWRDWLDNALYAYSGDITTSGTYKDAKARQQKAIDKYGAPNIISVGHSRAGKYVEELNKEQPVKEVITYNKAAHPNTVFQTNPENQTDVRTNTDVVSALSPLQFSKNKTVTIPSGYDLLKAHKPSALSYLGNKLIGRGSDDLDELIGGMMPSVIRAMKEYLSKKSKKKLKTHFL
jgi:hypothetical protein